MKILYIHKAYYDKRPPIISTVERLLKLNHSVKLVTSGISYNTQTILKERGVDVYDFGMIPDRKISKIPYYYNYKKGVKRIIKDNSDYIVWVASGDAALVIGRILFKMKYILQLQELYDTHKLYFRKLKKFAQNSTVNVVPSNYRAILQKHYYKLDNLAQIMHNRPFHHPRQVTSISDTNARNILDNLKNKKIILYQGGIDFVRNSHNLIKISEQLSEDYVLVMMGPLTERIKPLFKNSKKVYHIPRIDAPYHLEITGHAHIGIIDYRTDALNNIFCAPNKIFEYSGYGIPIVSNELLCLTPVSALKVGETFSYDRPVSFYKAIMKVSENHSFYRKNAINYFESVNVMEEMNAVLEAYKENCGQGNELH
jgi:hypothetical protein